MSRLFDDIYVCRSRARARRPMSSERVTVTLSSATVGALVIVVTALTATSVYFVLALGRITAIERALPP